MLHFSPATMHSARIARFGSGATILRARGNDPLTLDQIAAATPSVFAADKHVSRSERYTYLPTSAVLEGLAKEGFSPFEVRQGGSRDEAKRGFTKHLIRLRHAGAALTVGGTHREVILLNSHDGTSSYQLMSGLFRMVCSNGLVVADGDMTGIRVPHKGNIVHQVIEGAYTVIDDGRRVAERIEHMQSITLASGEQLAFAEAAAALRFEHANSPVTPAQVNAPRRADDQGADLWRTFNRAQENLERGGLSYVQRDERGRATARRDTRPVRSIDGNMSLNRALWLLAERMGELKAAA